MGRGRWVGVGGKAGRWEGWWVVKVVGGVVGGKGGGW